MKNLLLLFLLFPLLSFSQVDIEESEGFIYGTTHYVKLQNSSKGLFQVSFTKYFHIGTKENTFIVDFMLDDFFSLRLSGGEKVLIKFSDNTVIEFVNQNDGLPKYNGSGYYYHFLCSIDEDQLTQIKEKLLVKIRLGFYKPRDYEIKESHSQELQKLAQEILQTDLEKTKKDDIKIYKNF
jgi:Lhr-like helicase